MTKVETQITSTHISTRFRRFASDKSFRSWLQPESLIQAAFCLYDEDGVDPGIVREPPKAPNGSATDFS